MFCLKKFFITNSIDRRMQTIVPHVITQTILDANNVGILKNIEFISFQIIYTIHFTAKNVKQTKLQ